jgi:hypothetical protein
MKESLNLISRVIMKTKVRMGAILRGKKLLRLGTRHRRGKFQGRRKDKDKRREEWEGRGVHIPLLEEGGRDTQVIQSMLRSSRNQITSVTVSLSSFNRKLTVQKEVERKRRNNISEGIDLLVAQMGIPELEKAGKAVQLRRAVEYMAEMGERLGGVDKELEDLRREKQDLEVCCIPSLLVSFQPN